MRKLRGEEDVTRGTRIAAVVSGKVIFATVSFVIGFGPDAMGMLFGHDEVVLLTSCLILG